MEYYYGNFCHAYSSQNPRYASDRVLVRLNTCGFQTRFAPPVKIRRGRVAHSVSLAPLGFATEYCMAALRHNQQPPLPERGRWHAFA